MDIAKDYSALTTIGGYAVLLLASIAVYLVTKKKKNDRPQPAKQGSRQTEQSLSAEIKRKAEKAVKPKPKPKAPSAAPTEPTPSRVDYDAEKEEAGEKKAAREFAHQMQKAVVGTKVNTKKADDKRQKSVKQSKAQEPVAEKESAPSSNAGDADDDLSPQVSPAVAAADTQGGVADMLEPVTSGPSVLRLTDTDSAKKPQQRKAKAPEPVETKKQRQNRKKAEQAKAAREEDEKDRKVKMEEQRRTARVAEGRAAKDGSAFMAQQQQNAWDNKPTNGTTPVQLLDTFDGKKDENSKPAVSKPAPAPAAPVDAYANLPSEEEQLEMIRAEDSWSEVKTKKKGKKKETPAAPVDSTPVPSSTKPVNGTKKPVLTSSNSSFAALTSEDIADEEEEAEQEWDV